MLSALLSFANGGYLGPFYVKGYAYNNDKNHSPVSNINAFALNYKITPLEQLHDTWLTYDSNLALYIQCLPTLKRMLNRVAWKEAFDHLQSHYFQTPGENSWSIRFSALGSALERLAYTILVEDRENEEIKQKHALLFNPKQSS